jgi:hypothetical protein
MVRTKPHTVRMVDFTDFNFRVSYQMERDFDVRTTTAKKIISEWTLQENVSVYKPSSVFPGPFLYSQI